MTAHAEKRNSLCQAHGVFKRTPVGHQRGGSHDSTSVSFDDAAIHARGEAKVIGIDDQTAHRVSLAGGREESRIGKAMLFDPVFTARVHSTMSGL